YLSAHVLTIVRDGAPKLRGPDYSYRMPAFGPDAESLVRALAEGDGERSDAEEPPPSSPPDPTLGPLWGPELVGARGYSCISCHVWKGKEFSKSDPGAVGPDLVRVVGRIRREWFDRFLEDPGRFAPGTPMPTIFEH